MQKKPLTKSKSLYDKSPGKTSDIGEHIEIIKVICTTNPYSTRCEQEKNSKQCKSGMKEGCLPSLYLFQVVYEVLEQMTSKGDKGDIDRKGKSQNIITDDTTLYMQDPKDATRKFQKLMNTFSKLSGYTQNSAAFLYMINNHTEKKRIPFKVASK